jgi:hypothetical protein
MATQTNSHPEDAAPEHAPKYEVGAVLRFVAYSPGEEWSVEDHAQHFEPGDDLVVLPKNGCGMGIDVRRPRDGFVDMVWPEEVVLVSPGGAG